jgi:hypothetical protein
MWWRCRQQDDDGGVLGCCLDTMPMPMHGWTSLAAAQANAIVNLSLSLSLSLDSSWIETVYALAREES